MVKTLTFLTRNVVGLYFSLFRGGPAVQVKEGEGDIRQVERRRVGDWTGWICQIAQPIQSKAP